MLTHTHRDHSPAAAALKAATGAQTYGEGPHRVSRPLHIGEINPLDAAGDMDFRPDHALADGDVIEGAGWTLEAVATPGHCANHMAYALKETNALFSGDHVMGWSTSIVAPPDGAMSDYMASLYKTRGRGRRRSISPATATSSATRRVSCKAISATGSGARNRSCTGSARARPTSRRWCARSISASIRG